MIATAELDTWPSLRRYVISRGGLGSGDWSPDLIPGGLYRRAGIAPDVLAAEMPHECGEAMGLWNPDDGSESMLDALTRAYAHHQRVREEKGRQRVSESRALPRGQRRLADHIDRLAEKWGRKLDLAAIGEAGEEIVRIYEAGTRLELEVGGMVRLVTVGCTGAARPEFVYLLSIPVLEVGEVAA